MKFPKFLDSVNVEIFTIWKIIEFLKLASFENDKISQFPQFKNYAISKIVQSEKLINFVNILIHKSNKFFNSVNYGPKFFFFSKTQCPKKINSEIYKKFKIVQLRKLQKFQIGQFKKPFNLQNC